MADTGYLLIFSCVLIQWLHPSEGVVYPAHEDTPPLWAMYTAKADLSGLFTEDFHDLCHQLVPLLLLL